MGGREHRSVCTALERVRSGPDAKEQAQSNHWSLISLSALCASSNCIPSFKYSANKSPVFSNTHSWAFFWSMYSGQVTKRLKAQFLWEYIKDREGAQENQRNTRPDSVGDEEDTPGLRGARILSPYVLLLPSHEAPFLPCKEILNLYLSFCWHHWKQCPKGSSGKDPAHWQLTEVSCASRSCRDNVCGWLWPTGPSESPGKSEAIWSQKWWQKARTTLMENKRFSSGSGGWSWAWMTEEGEGEWMSRSWCQHCPMLCVYFTLCFCSVY